MKTRTFIATALAGTMAFGTAGFAFAQQSDSESVGMIAAERDGQRTITLGQAKARAERRFARMDANEDGVISAADRTARREARFSRMDADGDGEVSLAEMRTAREARQERRAARRAMREARRFERLDTDGSGTLSTAELAEARDMRTERRARRSERRAGTRGEGRRAMRLLRRADADGDRQVSRAEFDTMVEARFARLDTDRSGTITPAEREAARQARKARRAS